MSWRASVLGGKREVGRSDMQASPGDPEQIHFRRRQWDGMRPERRSNQIKCDPTWPAQIRSPLAQISNPPPTRSESRSSLRQRCQRLCHSSSLAPPHMPAVGTVRGRRQSSGTGSRRSAKAHAPKLPVLLPCSSRRRRRHVLSGPQPEPEIFSGKSEAES